MKKILLLHPELESNEIITLCWCDETELSFVCARINKTISGPNVKNVSSQYFSIRIYHEFGIPSSVGTL